MKSKPAIALALLSAGVSHTARELRHATVATRERRMVTGKVEVRALTDAEKADGYIGALTGIIPLNTDSVVLRDRRLNNGQPFVERIAPKAFDGASEVMGMAGHTEYTLAAFARQGVNLTLTETATELRWDARIPNTSAGRDLLELGSKGIVRGTSFEFDVGAEDHWEKRSDGTSVRTVKRGKLSTVNPVIWPAYDDSELSVSMRSRAEQEDRSYYLYQDRDFTWNDRTVTPDCAYGLAAIGAATCVLAEALRYLREQPAGALVDLARAQVVHAAEQIKTLTDFLVANGATINPDALQRATERLTEARASASAKEFPQPSPRERQLRALHR
jgi:HK97 family phage prohead protease